ncbi:septation ring formation regulator EzrA [Bacillus sp. DNRA2]|uniref:septation ring formation regulator EzrA n=1 Tax=Bacillus sp. DNRA2 TaxID=2723053 RepID=UPI00145E5C02|nr:septation ring formation regulator EzrA [Bacillus sp. DNRA2]NMD70767.1 septation ring formation regulator EzrA [Bacillus sp. DNRA2]
MGFVIGGIGIVLIIVVALLGYIKRKNFFKEIDRLENWKVDISNRPVHDELAKVKQLNMTGQTEQLFEQWRKQWDEIVTVQLPELDVMLFEAEEAIDKLQFKKATNIQVEIASVLEENELEIKKILAELHDLVGSEQKNREEAEGLKGLYRESKKALLAHRHTFGNTVEAFEQQLDEMIRSFQLFEEKTENGDYLEAREIVLTIKDRMQVISEKMRAIPKLLVDCESGLPMQINELKDGYREMVEQGYKLDHLQFEEEVNNLEQQIALFLAQLSQTEVNAVEQGIDAVKDTIDQFYDLLEKEVLAKHYVQKHKDEIKEALQEIAEHCRMLNEETDYVRQIYHLAEAELETQRNSEKQITKLLNRYQILEQKISEQGYAQTQLSAELTEVKEMIEEIAQEQLAYQETLRALRKDELAAREKVIELKRKMGETIRMVSKSKIPGLPKEYEFLLDDAEDSIEDLIEKLGEKPLDMNAVHHFLELSELSVETLASGTNEMIENVRLAEKVIQYGNRYKSKYPSVAEGLNEAELAFREFDYKTALEQAATTIEKVEPGALKKIEAMMTEKIL